MILRTRTKIILSILLALVLFMVVINIVPPKKVLANNPFIIEEGDRPLIAAHRGGKNLNPENTMLAIDYSVEQLNVDIIEMDVYLTKDNHLVLSHNAEINNYTELYGEEDYYIRDHTLAELQKFNFGYRFKDKQGNFIYQNLLDGVSEESKSSVLLENRLRVLTTIELFEKYKNSDLLYIIEIKDSGDRGVEATDILVSQLAEYNLLNKVAVGTYNAEVEEHLQTSYSDPNKTFVIRGASMKTAASFIATELLKVNLFDKSTFHCLQIPTSYDLKIKGKTITLNLDKKMYVNRAHRRGISVQYWTINDKEEMRKLIELGADVIMTDNPDVMKELLDEMGY